MVNLRSVSNCMMDVCNLNHLKDTYPYAPQPIYLIVYTIPHIVGIHALYLI